MKTKQFIYFLLMLTGFISLVWGGMWIEETIAKSIGFILLFAGIYAMTRTYSSGDHE